MAPGGEAVARRDDGLIVFVPGGAPGDRALVSVEQTKKNHARGRLVSILSPGPSRVAPACALAVPEACGGCPLMPVQRTTQLIAKEDWVRRALRPSRLQATVEIAPILAPAPELCYRLRARLSVRDGKLGFAGAKSHRGATIASCPVLVPALDQVLFQHGAALTVLLGEGATVRGLYGQQNGRPAVHLAVELTPRSRRNAVLRELEKLLAEDVVCGVVLQDADQRTVLGAATIELGAESDLGPFFGAADGFAQPSVAGHTVLPRLVAEAIEKDARILELFSGSGNLTRALRSLGSELVCVESDAAAASRAQQLFGAAKAMQFLAQPALAATRTLAKQGARFDVVVLDPPRAGAVEELPHLAALHAHRIIYVSCDPMTLGRDLAALVPHGYQPTRVQPIDLMPHTSHVECVAIVEKN